MTEPKITRHAQTLCPNCQYRLNASGDPEYPAASPKPGDFSICLRCAATLIFTDDVLHLRMMTPAEIEALSPQEREDLNQHVAEVLALIRAEGFH